MQGRSLLPVLAKDERLREGALFGYFGGAVNVADGRYTYFRYPGDIGSQEVFQYTVMPTHLRELFTPEELSTATLAPPFPFTKGVPLLRVPVIERSPMYANYGPGALLDRETVLFDLQADPEQLRPVHSPEVEGRLSGLMAELMTANEAPDEAFARIGLERAPCPAERCPRRRTKGGRMIIRAWRGRASRSRSDAYPRHFCEAVVPALRDMPGFLGAAAEPACGAGRGGIPRAHALAVDGRDTRLRGPGGRQGRRRARRRRCSRRL